MTGTGTQTDPYIVMNADELIEATSASEGGSTRYVKLGADINMDGHVNVNMYFYELDGDGHSITNINVENTNGLNIHIQANNTTIKNISFTSCSVLISGALIYFVQDNNGNWTTKIYNCTFSLKLTSVSRVNSGMWFKCPEGNSSRVLTAAVERCVVDITFTSNDCMMPLLERKGREQINIAWSHINIDAKITQNYSNATLFYINNYNNCYLTGKVEFANTSGSYSESSIFQASNGYNNTYAAVHGINVMVPIFNSSTVYGVVFYDGDIYSKVADLKYKRLTTAQCKDIEYLNSIGFDVVPGE